MARTFTCPFCGGYIVTDKQFGIATCPDCHNTMGIGDLQINQNIIDREHELEQEAEIRSENAWLTYAENAGEYAPREEMLIANDPFFQEAEARMRADVLLFEAQEDTAALLLDGGM